MVAQRLKNRPLLRTLVRQFDERLKNLVEKRVPLESAFAKVVVHLDLLPGAPEVHQLVHLVDERHRLPARRFKTQVAPPPSLPRFEFHLGAAPAVRFLGVVGFERVSRASRPRLSQEVVLIDQRGVRQIARQRVKDARADGGIPPSRSRGDAAGNTSSHRPARS